MTKEQLNESLVKTLGTFEKAVDELKTLIEALKKEPVSVDVETPMGILRAFEKGDTNYPGLYIEGVGEEGSEIVAMVEYDDTSKQLQTVVYTPDSDEPKEIFKQGKCFRIPDRKINCEQCGCDLVWEHPQVPGMYQASGEYVESKLCYSCQSEYCRQTNCLSCTVGKYPQCRFSFFKEGDCDA